MRFKITCSWKGYKDYSFLEVITANAIPSAFPNAPTTIPSRPSASPTLSHQTTLSISPTAHLSKTPSAMPTMVPTSKPSESPTKSVAPSRKPSSLVPSVTRISHPSALPTAMPSMSSAPSRQASHLAYLHLRQIQVPNPHRSRVLRTNFKSVIRSIYESTIFSPTNSTTQR